jgi:hypothetical protein
MKEKGDIYDSEWAKTLEEMEDESIEDEMDRYEEFAELQKKFDKLKYDKLAKEVKKMANDTKNK